MSEVPKSDTGIHATADATNPFAPIDYTSRLKTPSRHTGTFHAMQPLQPGQLYGTAHWMSPPLSLIHISPASSARWRTHCASVPCWLLRTVGLTRCVWRAA